MAYKFPGIADVNEKNLLKVVKALKESVEVLIGRRGDEDDAYVRSGDFDGEVETVITTVSYVGAHATTHTDGTDDIQNATAGQKGLATAAQITKLDGIENAATRDQTDSEIETAYNNQVSVVSQAEAEAGVSATVRRWSALRVYQAILARARDAINNVIGSDGKADAEIDLDGNTLSNPKDPTAGTHVGDRDYNDARYSAAATAALQAHSYKIDTGETLDIGDYEQIIFEEQLIIAGTGEVSISGTGFVVIQGQG